MRFVVDSDFQYGNRGQEQAKKGHAENIILQEAEFVLVPGDTTNSGYKGKILFWGNDEFPRFEAEQLKPLENAGIDVYFGDGNHEGAYVNKVIKCLLGNTPMRKWYIERHGGLLYHFERDGFRFVCLGMHPTSAAMKWMRENVPADKPIFVYWHFGVNDGFSIENGWWSEQDRDLAFDVLFKYNVMAVFVGHLHTSYYRQYTHTLDGEQKTFDIICPAGSAYALVEVDSSGTIKSRFVASNTPFIQKNTLTRGWTILGDNA